MCSIEGCGNLEALVRSNLCHDHLLTLRCLSATPKTNIKDCLCNNCYTRTAYESRIELKRGYGFNPKEELIAKIKCLFCEKTCQISKFSYKEFDKPTNTLTIYGTCKTCYKKNDTN